VYQFIREGCKGLEGNIVKFRMHILLITGAIVFALVVLIKTMWIPLGESLLPEVGGLNLTYSDRQLIQMVSSYYLSMTAMNAGLAAGTLAIAFALAPRLRNSRNRLVVYPLYFGATIVFLISTINYSVYSTIHYRLIDQTLSLEGLQNVSIPGFESRVSRQLGFIGLIFMFIQQQLFKEGLFYAGIILFLWVLFILIPLLSLKGARRSGI